MTQTKTEQTTGTDQSGNTKPDWTMKKHRCYIMTIWEEPLTHFEKAVYEVWCDDTCKDGKPHKHQVIYFKNPISFNSIKKIYKTSHIEKARSVYDAIHYIKDNKNGRKHNIEEIGTEPKDTRFHTVKDLKDCKDPDLIPWNQYNIWTKIQEKERRKDELMNMLDEIEKDDLKAPEIIYFTGPSGKGKTYGAYKCAMSKFEKADIGKITIENNFLSVSNEEAKCFVIEEFRPSQMHAANFLQLIDKYGYDAPIKGGHIYLRPQCIIICSIISPYELYANEEVNKQFTRRITEIHDLNEPCI